MARLYDPITLTYLGIVGVLLNKVWFSKNGVRYEVVTLQDHEA